MRVLLIILSILIFISCSSYIYKNGNIELYETTYNQLKVETEIEIENEYDINLEGDSNKYLILESRVTIPTGEAEYLHAFRNDTLIYFGYPYQFSQSSNSSVNELGKKYAEIFIHKKMKSK